MDNRKDHWERYLVDQILQSPGRILLILGEGFPLEELNRLVSSELHIISNRYDLYKRAQDIANSAEFSDLRITEKYDHIFLRIFKDKSANHHLINSAVNHLQTGGILTLAGCRNEGIKTFAKKGELRLGSEGQTEILGNGVRICRIPLGSTPGDKLPDKNYSTLRQKCVKGLPRLFSKPGIFGWEKEDQGSRFLMENIDFPKDGHVLDLGCGYGYLSIEAWKRGAKYIISTDNNAAALEACRSNFKEFGLEGQVIADDCGRSIKENFDLILCNPPFHRGHGESREITLRFMTSIKNHLKPGGRAYIVVNAFIPVEKVLKSLGLLFKEGENNGQFKILEIRL